MSVGAENPGVCTYLWLIWVCFGAVVVCFGVFGAIGAVMDSRERLLGLLEYEVALRDAERDLVRFCELTMPDPRYPDDVFRSRYEVARHHRFMADVMMGVERGERLKVIQNLPPRHGKSEMTTKRFAAWAIGRDPTRDIMVATYNEKFAADFGLEIRGIIESPRYRQIFPDVCLDKKTAEHVTTTAGGNLYFLGRRSSTTGRGADIILVDDPTKDDRESRYDTFREDLWQWFTQTLLSRRHTDRAAVVVTQTRWHEDDIPGRITDVHNPAYSEKFAKGFEVLSLPAIALEDDLLGRRPGKALWPERFGREYLDEMQEANAVSFAALYQGDPTPAEGVYYQADEIREYQRGERPDNLRMFVVSDHAVSTRSYNDPTCMIPFGIDPDGVAWVMDQICWRRLDSSSAVEEMLKLMEQHRPAFWYAEKGHISKSIGPFLKKRMDETGIYCPVIEEHPPADKLQRAHSGRARSAQGKIRFPAYANWWPRAKAELLKFPNARHDDFVDCISMIGLKLAMHQTGAREVKVDRTKPGTFGHLLKEFRDQDRARAAKQARAGW